jgi:hypothetical protein
LVEAHRLAERGKNAFPDSIGGRRCHNLIQQIEAPESRISTERVWNRPLPKIEVDYRNLTKVHLRVVGVPYEQRLKSAENRPEHVDQEARLRLLAQKPLKQWSVDLPPTEDYQERSFQIEPPEDLPPGFYFLISSHDEGFRRAGQHGDVHRLLGQRSGAGDAQRQGEPVAEGSC